MHLDSRNASDKDRNITNTMDLQSPRAARKTQQKVLSIKYLCSLWPEEENLKRYSIVATSRAVWLKVRAVEPVIASVRQCWNLELSFDHFFATEQSPPNKLFVCLHVRVSVHGRIIL
jgi:hypothetical protein